MLAQSVNHVTLDTSPSPTKSERDSVGFWKGWCGARDGGAAIPPVVARIFSGDSTSPLTREARIWCEAKALLLYQNDNERIYHAKKCINYAESGINRNPFLPPLEKGEVARLIQIFRLLYSIQIVLPLQF